MTGAGEPIVLDAALPWLLLREQAADALQRLATLDHPIARTRLAREVARAARLELETLPDREAVAIRDVLAVIEAALKGAP